MKNSGSSHFALLSDDDPPVKFCSWRKIALFTLILAGFICIGVTIFLLYPLYVNKPSENEACSNVPDLYKFDCFPNSPVTKSECLKKGCCYHDEGSRSKSFPPLNVPYCFYPTNYVGYKVSNYSISLNGGSATLTRETPSGFPKDVKSLLLEFMFIDDNSLRIKITDPNSDRFEVPIPLHYTTKEHTNSQYRINITKDGDFSISRKSSGVAVFKTSLSRLVFADQFLEIASLLPSQYVYGIGEQMDGLLRSVNWTRYTLFNRDQEPFPNINLYGSQPFYMALDADGNANGVFLYNSNAMDVVLQPTPAITFRTVGGILDLFVLLGPSPKEVIQQYTGIIGRTFMPPYWSFGFHLCRFGYRTLNRTKEIYQQMVDSGIPFDVQWNDIDYMERRNDFTYDKVQFAGLPEFVNELHQNGMHYMVIVDPGISNSEANGTYPPYDDGIAMDIFVKNSTDQIFIGQVWNKGHTVFPDFSHPSAQFYWEKQFQQFHSAVAIDGAWIDMNEPSNFYNGQIDGCPNVALENPPYVPGGETPLRTKTLCMTAKHYNTTHYNEHNIYAYRETVATNIALRKIRPNQRPFIISRASFIGQGLHGGHWSGDIASNWGDMRYTITSMINFNLYGISMIGSDICGFNGNTTEELCARWQALGAFYPFSRNHNTDDGIDQDPVSLGPTVVEASKKSLLTRYYLLPYLYTLFYRSHVFGETVVRPLFFEFINDVNTFSIDEQFLWGPALMITPALYPNITEVVAYFPQGIWYDFHSGTNRSSSGQRYTLASNLTTIRLFVRGGHILPLQLPSTTTTLSRQNDFELFVALDDKESASGELYWDDGDSLDTYENKKYNLIQFVAEKNTLNSTIENNGYQINMPVGNIKVYGVQKVPTNVIINQQETSFTFNENRLFINATGFSLLQPLAVIWS